ncbi:GntR family transcriptional regulator [Microbacterium sp. LS_15]|uniref:GntR family transcriptional regulator n=1 Tax=Microbacterium sp. LS_15 TaxID=3055790 RepID=UPI0035C03B8A
MPIPSSNSPVAAGRVLLRDIVKDRLQSAIMDGTFAPGEVLHDRELMDWLGVSRTPLRDAINELTRAGLIEMEPNRFTRVADPSPEETEAAFHTLGVIYGGVVRLAIPRLTRAQRDSIVVGLDSMREAVLRRDPAEIRKFGFPTLALFEPATGNSLLVKLCRDTVDGLAFKVRTPRLLEMYDPGETAGAFAALRDAVVSKDALAGELAIERVFQLPT